MKEFVRVNTIICRTHLIREISIDKKYITVHYKDDKYTRVEFETQEAATRVFNDIYNQLFEE